MDDSTEFYYTWIDRGYKTTRLYLVNAADGKVRELLEEKTDLFYRLGDITKKAANLKGKLMLAYGAMDDNVTMSQTLRLCDELNRNDKIYDLVVLPRCNHNVPAEPYFMKRKLLFFIDNLLQD